MITQKPISLKIDTTLLEELDYEVSIGWRKRNNHINMAIKFYLEYLDCKRRSKIFHGDVKTNILNDEFIKKWFPELYQW